MNADYFYWAIPVLLVLVSLGAGFAVWRYWNGARHEQAMLRLLAGADRLEAAIKQCRRRLDQAHAAVRVAPGVPSAGSAEAATVIDEALRDLLAHRLWIRDAAPAASRAELLRAAAAMDQAQARLEGYLAELDDARLALEDAVRTHARAR